MLPSIPASSLLPRRARPPIALTVLVAIGALGARAVDAPIRSAERSGAAVSDLALAASPGRELEALTDRARARLAAGDARTAAAALRAASRRLAAASRTEADSAAARALSTSAHELLTLADGAEGGVVPPARAVDAAVLRARLADARMHHARVLPLVRNLRNAQAGIELLWAVDQLGGVLHDAVPRADVGMTALLDDARAAALRLTRPELGVPASTGVVLERLALALDRAVAGTLACGGTSLTTSTEREATVIATRIEIPASMRAEHAEKHAEIHAALERATRAPGRVGEAARERARILHPHVVGEEEPFPPAAVPVGDLDRARTSTTGT